MRKIRITLLINNEKNILMYNNITDPEATITKLIDYIELMKKYINIDNFNIEVI